MSSFFHNRGPGRWWRSFQARRVPQLRCLFEPQIGLLSSHHLSCSTQSDGEVHSIQGVFSASTHQAIFVFAILSLLDLPGCRRNFRHLAAPHLIADVAVAVVTDPKAAINSCEEGSNLGGKSTGPVQSEATCVFARCCLPLNASDFLCEDFPLPNLHSAATVSTNDTVIQ